MHDANAGSKPLSLRDDAIAVLKRLRDNGHVAYFAGGCVRDMLMQRDPKDYDVATDATPERVRTLFTNTQAVGAAFGVVLVRHQRSVIEVATFRTDLEYKDGRHPSGVRFSTPEEDAARRDFTINGIFYDPIADRIIDYVGGQDDIRGKTLRAIGDPAQRFAEDHLRLLRAVRFASRFGLTIEVATASAIKRDAAKLISISPERVGEELRLILTPVTRIAAWKLLNHFGFAEVIYRFLPARDCHENRATANEIFDHTAPGQDIPFHLALAAASLEHRLSSTGEPDIRVLCATTALSRLNQALRKSLKLSNAESDGLVGTLGGVGVLIQEEFPRVAQLKRFLAHPHAAESRELARAIAAVGLHSERVSKVVRFLAELERTDFAPPPFVTGDDLTAAGLRPGPAFKRILDEVYDAQLESRVTNKDEAMALTLSMR